MWLCCCSFLACSDVRTLHSEDQNSFRMDVELLREQYSSSRDTHRRHTHVVCFRNADCGDAEINGRGFLDVVPSVLRSQAVCVLDVPHESWSSDLDVKRPTHWTGPSEHRRQCSAGGSESDGLSEDSNPHLKATRKLSAPVLLSSDNQRSRYYPFPQKKSLRKSETARRLGLYASF